MLGAWKSWDAMIKRCRNHPRYYEDVSVCERWLSFDNFYVDMGDRPEGMTLDRIDPFGDYEPGNCRWATWHIQRMNRRQLRATHCRRGHELSPENAYPNQRTCKRCANDRRRANRLAGRKAA
jgi:hypothetical protein